MERPLRLLGLQGLRVVGDETAWGLGSSLSKSASGVAQLCTVFAPSSQFPTKSHQA